MKDIVTNDGYGKGSLHTSKTIKVTVVECPLPPPTPPFKVKITNDQFCSVFTYENMSHLSSINEPSVPMDKFSLDSIDSSCRTWTHSKLRDLTTSLEWKQALVAPIFKKGDKTSPSNYCPISPTVVYCKILEHVIHNLVKHLDRNKILSDQQHGFRKRRFCEDHQLNYQRDRES